MFCTFQSREHTLQVLLLALSDVYELLRHGCARNQERAALLAEYARLRAAQGSPQQDRDLRASSRGAPVYPAATAAGRGQQPAQSSGGAAGLDCPATDPQQPETAVPAEATTFSRETTKFWVQPHDLMWVKCALVRHLPLSVYGRRSRVAALEGEGRCGTVLDGDAMPQLHIQSAEYTFTVSMKLELCREGRCPAAERSITDSLQHNTRLSVMERQLPAGALQLAKAIRSWPSGSSSMSLTAA